MHRVQSLVNVWFIGDLLRRPLIVFQNLVDALGDIDVADPDDLIPAMGSVMGAVGVLLEVGPEN